MIFKMRNKRKRFYRKHKCHVYIRKGNTCEHYPKDIPINEQSFKREIIVKKPAISKYG